MLLYNAVVVAWIKFPQEYAGAVFAAHHHLHFLLSDSVPGLEF